MEELDVVFSDVGVAILIPELDGFFGADELVGEIFNLAGRLRAVVEMKHVAFLLEPVAEVRALEVKGRPVRGDEVAAIGVDELRLRGKRGGERGGESDEKYCEPFRHSRPWPEVFHCNYSLVKRLSLDEAVCLQNRLRWEAALPGRLSYEPILEGIPVSGLARAESP